MNERSYTLAEQAGATRWDDELNGNTIDFSPESLEKFAKLIVKECCDVLYDNEMGGYQVNYVLKEHFGVE